MTLSRNQRLLQEWYLLADRQWAGYLKNQGNQEFPLIIRSDRNACIGNTWTYRFNLPDTGRCIPDQCGSPYPGKPPYWRCSSPCIYRNQYGLFDTSYRKSSWRVFLRSSGSGSYQNRRTADDCHGHCSAVLCVRAKTKEIRFLSSGPTEFPHGILPEGFADQVPVRMDECSHWNSDFPGKGKHRNTLGIIWHSSRRK